MNLSQRLQRAWQEVPVVFLIAPVYYLFLIVVHCMNYAGDYDLPVFSTTLAWLLGALACAVGLVGLRRWAGIGFVLITVARWSLRYFYPDHPGDTGFAAFPLELVPDVVLAAMVLFFFRRLR